MDFQYRCIDSEPITQRYYLLQHGLTTFGGYHMMTHRAVKLPICLAWDTLVACGKDGRPEENLPGPL